MPIDKGTLAGYDQLLSISQEAINRQLEVLYLTEVDPPLEDGPKHLINHEMHFHRKIIHEDTGEVFIAREGLDAYVCCPKIEFSGDSIPDEIDRYREAVIRFRFRPGENWEVADNLRKNGERVDSVVTFPQIVGQTPDGNDIKKFQKVAINGWEISWNALIDKTNVKDVFEEILKPAAAKDSSLSINKGLETQLWSVNTSSFQVSTIFCAMQSSRLIRSFRIFDENGNKPSNLKTIDGNSVGNAGPKIIETLKNMLLEKFTSGDDVTPPLKGPSPDNPFVLGYAISQAKPELGLVNPAAARAKIPTPAFFMPKTFRCNLSPKSMYSAGTLNYCMLTHRASGPPDFASSGKERLVDYGIDGAGRFKENVFARIKSKAQPGSTEGALFFCQDIFVNHWIGSSVAPLFYLSPESVTTQLSKMIEEHYEKLNIKGAMTFEKEIKRPTRTLSQDNTYRLTNTLRSGRKIIVVNPKKEPTESMKLEYNTAVDVKYENVNDLRDDEDSLKRRLRFTIGSYTFIKIKFFRRLLISQVTGALMDAGSDVNESFGGHRIRKDYADDIHWEEAYDANVWLNFRHVFDVGTSPHNRGSFTVENLRSEHLNSDDQVLGYQNGPPGDDPTKAGVWRYNHMHNWAETFKFAFESEMANLESIGEEAAKNCAGQFQNALKSLTDSLGTTIILPAGDVFMFKGMSADGDYNVFTTISYDTPIGGTIQLQAAKDVSLSAWQTPKPPTK